MQLFKRILFGLLCSVLAMSLGGVIYIVQMIITDKLDGGDINESAIVATEIPTEVPTEVPTPEPTTIPESNLFVITTDVVNLREAPTTESAVINKVPKDTVLNLLYKDDEWAYVTYGGQQVYVSVEFIAEYTQP